MIRVLVALALAGSSVAFRITDPRIDEASGIAAGLRSPGVVYVQNDSGDRNRFFALNARTGAVAATVTVPGATNVDWEDIAVATDADGTPSVWLADIGDNTGQRHDIRVYRVREPRIDAGDDDRRIETGRPDVYRLRYPDGPQDAESLAVAPGGAAYVVTKSLVGESAVFGLPARPAPSVQTLRRVASLHLGPGSLATGAAFSRDGRTLAVRTYSDAFVWRVPGTVAAALRTAPRRVALPRQRQGEGIAVVGTRLLVDSEGVGQPVYSVPLPAAATPTTSASSPTPSPSPSTSPSAAAERHATRTPLGLAVLLVLVAGIYLLTRRRERRR